MKVWARSASAFAFIVATRAFADDMNADTARAPSAPDSSPVEEVVVRGGRDEPEAASQSTAGHRELELRPRLRTGDLLESVPGLVVVQPEGGGKANQYFLRGFDADHGTDVAFFADGVPVNLVSHAHGQGYADFGFIIPELIVGVDATKGPYDASYGDFATAGAVNVRLAEALGESYAQLSAGSFGITRGLFVASPKLGDTWRAVMATEVYREDGPFTAPEGLGKFNVFLRATHDLGPRSRLSATWMSYGSSWSASGQIPERAVCGEGTDAPGCIGRFDTMDPSQGGSTQRHSLSLAYSLLGHDTDLHASAYALRYGFKMFSNFTFFAQDPVRGDELEQDDDRTMLGADVRVRTHAHYRDVRLTTTLGADARADLIESGLLHDQARVPLAAVVRSDVVESELGAFAQEELRLNRFVRFVAGLRVDRVDVHVDDRLSGASGAGDQALPSPKLTAVVSPIPGRLELFADYGRGFHSNDARGTILARDAVTLMAPATGYELGIAATPLRGLHLDADVFLLDLDSELVWNGDTGTTSALGRTRRYGLELGARYRVSNWLFADVDASFVCARFRDAPAGADLVPLAPTRTFSAGIGAKRRVGSWTLLGSVRVRSIDDRAATPDGSLVAQGFTVVDANASVRWRDVELGLDVQNLLDTTWRQTSFAVTSRLPSEPQSVTGINYTPGWPRTVMGRATLYWR